MKYKTILIDPPWPFTNNTGKVAPEHKRLYRYPTMKMQDILDLDIKQFADVRCHLYLWIPNALIKEGLETMEKWGFKYKTNIIWYKIRADGGPDHRGMGFYFRNVTEILLFGIINPKGEPPFRTIRPWNIPNIILSRKRDHSRKPEEIYDLIERCSHGPYLELFARSKRKGWDSTGNQLKV